MRHTSRIMLLSIALMFLPTISCSHAADAPPNVVMIISDDQAWTDYGFMGHPHIQTPCLDRLAQQSLLYTRGYVPSPLCRPSLAAMITGLYPHQNRITGNDPAPTPDIKKNRQNPAYLALNETMIAHIETHPTLPRLLAKKGYVSLQTGKWWEGHPRRGGFTHAMTHGDPRRGGRHGDVGLTIGREGMKPICDFIDQATADSKPFFLWYAPFMPHTPHTPPMELFEKYQKLTDSRTIARYWAMCEWFDQTCGQLLDYLDKKGLADNTIVVYVCDNGWIQNPKSGGYAPRSKRSPYEGGIRTPIMVRWLGKVKPRRDETHLAISIDLAPTILRACGLQPTADMTGVNLADTQAVAGREAVCGEVYAHDVADVNQPTKSLQYRWVIHDQWKLIDPDPANLPNSKPELYNVIDDPHEKRNLADEHPQRVKQLQKRLDAWWRRK